MKGRWIQAHLPQAEANAAAQEITPAGKRQGPGPQGRFIFRQLPGRRDYGLYPTRGVNKIPTRDACLMCPSSQPDMADAVSLGMRGGTVEAPYVSYLGNPVPVSGELLALSGPVEPAEVFRFAARCDEGACRHFNGADCRLAERIVQILPVVVDSLPPCKIRPDVWPGENTCVHCGANLQEAVRGIL